MAIELPTLYSRDAKKGIVQWTIRSDNDVVITQHGALGGKQVTHRAKAEPTNVGRANQRLGPAQAEFEAQAAWTKKRKEGYSETIEAAESTEILIPMKAKRLDDKAKSKIVWPQIHAQLKLNGLRCTAFRNHDGVILKSYGQEVWNIPHIEAAVQLFANEGDILDGEIYVHGVPLQTLNSWVKNEARPERLALQYHVYDLPRAKEYSNAPWSERLETLTQRWAEYVSLENVIQHVQTIENVDETRIKQLELDAIANGYEGLILRYVDGEYGWDTRSKHVLKWKNFQDRNFEIVDVLPREYNVNGVTETIADVFVLRNDVTGGTFKAVPLGSVAVRKQYLADRETLIGKTGIVRFLELSVDGVPQGNPTFRGLRLSEDKGETQDNDPWA